MSRACLPNIVCCGASSLNVMQHSTLRCDDTPRQSGTRSCRILRGKGPVLLLCVSVSLFFSFPFFGIPPDERGSIPLERGGGMSAHLNAAERTPVHAVWVSSEKPVTTTSVYTQFRSDNVGVVIFFLHDKHDN